ncbi:pyrroline-5-carboxylate reductase [Metabacillus indicus]|uniref:pyrroline-5-carboxylate reductase n=1 Tax=Metabacillus indicus TaxID=246786 RepID=UPI002493B049|nr:pyrroline-5-carboxylate reductase [Metabacillus indicus]
MKNIAFTGAGAIAEAIINGLISDGVCLPGQLIVTNHSNDERLSFLKESYGVSVTRDKQEAVKHADIIILAMKPKDVRSGIESIREHVTDSHLIISVLAGISTETIQELFGKKLSVIRAMPNTSAAIRKSATALACTSEVSQAEMDAASELFRAIGTVVHVSENQLDAVTGLSGSGPAYIYYLAEALEAAAADNGIEAHTAKALIAQTFLGAAEMLLHSGKQPELLRKEVTSPGGTTEAGIARLEHYAVKKALRECVKTATERSAEMGELFAKNAQKEHT